MGPASCDASPTGSVGLLQQLEVALADDGSTTSTCRASLPIAWRHSDLVSTVLGVSERTRVLLASKHHGGAEHLSTAGTAALTTAQQTVLCQPAQSTDTCMSPLCCPWPPSSYSLADCHAASGVHNDRNHVHVRSTLRQADRRHFCVEPWVSRSLVAMGRPAAVCALLRGDVVASGTVFWQEAALVVSNRWHDDRWAYSYLLQCPLQQLGP